MGEFLKKVGALIWIVFGLFVLMYCIISAAQAAVHDRWTEGCFWLIAICMMYAANKEKNT